MCLQIRIETLERFEYTVAALIKAFLVLGLGHASAAYKKKKKIEEDNRYNLSHFVNDVFQKKFVLKTNLVPSKSTMIE